MAGQFGMHEILQRSWCQRYGQRDSTEDNNCKAYLAQNAAQSCIVERILTRPEAQYKTTGTRKPSSVRFLRQGAACPYTALPAMRRASTVHATHRGPSGTTPLASPCEKYSRRPPPSSAGTLCCANQDSNWPAGCRAHPAPKRSAASDGRMRGCLVVGEQFLVRTVSRRASAL